MMASSETLFNPQDKTFEERMRAYIAVCKDYARVKASMKHSQLDQNISFIGDKDEVASAYKMISQSFKEASGNISQKDIKDAAKNGLLSDAEIAEIVKLQRQQKASESRKERIVSDSRKSKRTR